MSVILPDERRASRSAMPLRDAARPRGGRILVQMNSLGLGGTEISAVQFASAVREHGFESVLVGPADSRPSGPSIHDVAAEYGVTVSEFDRPTSALRAARLFDSLAAQARADIVHVYGQGAMRGAYLGPCRLARRPLVHTAYEMAVDPYSPTGTELIVGTRYLLEDAAGRRGATTLISPPVDLARDAATQADGAGFRAQWGIGADERMVVWVGRLDREMKQRAVETLLDAVEGIDAPVRVVIVGSGSAEEELRRRGERVNTRLGRTAIVFTGSLSDPRPAYAAADVSVGMGASAARALAFGTALVVVGETGWSQTFTPDTAADLHRNSFWNDIEILTPEADLARALTALVREPARIRELGAYGRRFAEEQFGLSAMSARLADVYRRSRTSYTARSWAHDAHREVRAAAYAVRRRLGWPGAQAAGGEYRYPL